MRNGVGQHIRYAIAVALLAAAVPAAAGDVALPAEVSGLTVGRAGADVAVAWGAVTTDALGNPEVVEHYRVYRGSGPRFPTEFALHDTSASPDATDAGAVEDGLTHFYLVTAVDDAGNEGGARPSTITRAPDLSGFWTASTIELDWTPAEPAGDVVAYRVYHGTSSRTYDAVVDVGLSTALSLTGLEPWTNHYAAVVAVDAAGAESGFSNEHVDALAGTVRVRGHDESRLCFNGCPAQPGEIQHDSGREVVVPVTFPEGDWTRVTLTFTVESRLCDDVPDKCGMNNPGWNPCGDPWDRTASVSLVLDDCVEQGARCFARQGNLELLRAVTPFGTDAAPPDGSGFVPPRVWSFDITPYASLLTGSRYLSAFIGVWVSPGWYVTTDFEFTEDPAQASPKPPADGVIAAWFRDGDNSTTPVPVTIPANATSVVARVFTTGHGGNTDPAECACAPNPCDEFCRKVVTINVNGTPRWGTIPWRTDCSPPGNPCFNWNACGYPSCTYPRSGWCPGYIACHEDPPCDQDIPMTSAFTPGATHDFLFDVRLLTAGASWTNSVAIYWYESP